MRVITPALDLIKKFEGLYLKAYLDPVGIPTIGWGTIRYPDGSAVKLGDVINEEMAKAYLMHEINQSCILPIDRLVKVPLNNNQFCALISFVYNLGQGNFASSTMLKKINASDFAGAALEFPRWNKAKGKVLAGLTRRRNDEMELFKKPLASTPSQDEAGNDAEIPSWFKPFKDIIDKILEFLSGTPKPVDTTKSLRDLSELV